MLGEPKRWESNLQLLIDLLMTEGKPTKAPMNTTNPYTPYTKLPDTLRKYTTKLPDTLRKYTLYKASRHTKKINIIQSFQTHF
jgi:hypothetical protein